MQWSREFLTAVYALDGVGPVTHQKCLAVLEECGCEEAEFWVNKHGIWGKMGLNKNVELSIQKFKKEYTSSSYFESLQQKNIRVIIPDYSEFPPLLKHTENFPPVMFARGGQVRGTESFVAVVGTRKITGYGKRLVRDFVPTLVGHGKTIVSGFMYGVDVAAQRLAVESGGKTIGVVGFGFDHMYPPDQRGLWHWFLEQGATFLSPFPPHVPARPGNFPARNKVVAGMSEGVLVIEGAKDSGSLITAHCAADLGREVWAVPGSVYSEFSVGTQKLINEGAHLVNTPEEVLGFTSRRQAKDMDAKRRVREKFSGIKRQVCEILWDETLTTDELSERLSCAPEAVAVHLIELEMLGIVGQKGNRWQLENLPDSV